MRKAAARAFVAVGSNIEPARKVREALRLLAARMRVVGVSTVYRTKALERPEQEDYYNCVVEVETDAPPLALRSGALRRIEAALGRKRSGDRFAPRTIDLDLIAYEGVEMKTESLTLPDPEILASAIPGAAIGGASARAGTDGGDAGAGGGADHGWEWDDASDRVHGATEKGLAA